MKKILPIIFVAAMAFVLLVMPSFAGSALDYAEIAPGGTVTNMDELIAAFGVNSYGEPNAELVLGTENEIRLKNSLIVADTIFIMSGDYVVHGGGCTVGRAEEMNSPIISIEGGSLTFERAYGGSELFEEGDEPSLTFDGRNQKGEAFIEVTGNASLTLNAKILIKNMNSSGQGGFVNATSDSSEIPSVSVYACRFENCSAMNGGAIFYSAPADKLGEDWQIVVKSCVFKKCTAYSGGAIWSQGNAYIASCNFTENSASEDGGALYLCAASDINTVTAENNNALNGGAVLYNTGTSAIVSLDALNNNARNGGVIFSEGSCMISEVYFYENIAESCGGAVYNKGAFYYNGGMMMGNECGMFGGGIYSEGGSVLKYSKGEITSSEAKYAGGIYSGGDLYMTGGAVGKNHGEAPHIAVFGKFEMSGSAVCYSGNVIGLVRNGEGNFPYVKLAGMLTNLDRQYIGLYSYYEYEFKSVNKSGARLFDGEQANIDSALKVFSVENSGIINYTIESSGVMAVSYVTWLIFGGTVIAAAGIAAGVVIWQKKRKKSAEK